MNQESARAELKTLGRKIANAKDRRPGAWNQPRPEELSRDEARAREQARDRRRRRRKAAKVARKRGRG